MATLDSDTGRNSTMLVDGQLVYLGVVTLVNIKVLTSTSNHTFFTFFFTFGSIMNYVICFYVINLIEASDIYMLFGFVFMNSLSYVAMFFIASALVIAENGLHLAQHKLKRIIEYREIEK